MKQESDLYKANQRLQKEIEVLKKLLEVQHPEKSEHINPKNKYAVYTEDVANMIMLGYSRYEIMKKHNLTDTQYNQITSQSNFLKMLSDIPTDQENNLNEIHHVELALFSALHAYNDLSSNLTGSELSALSTRIDKLTSRYASFLV